MFKLFTTLLISLGCATAAPAQDWLTDYTASGTNLNESFSTSLIVIGDVNGDGQDDFVVSSPRDDAGEFNSGSISILSGIDGSVIVKRNGELYSEGTGVQLAYLGTHNGDQKIKFASSSPFFDINNGIFSGVVRIYAYDLATSTLDLYTTLEGSASGQMFGMSLAGYQYDSAIDSDLELAVGAIGHNSLDGAIYVYQIDPNTQEASLVDTIEGVAGQKELLGYSLSAAILDGEQTLFMGSPFANDLAPRCGAVSLIQNTGAIISLENPFASVANAHVGAAVAAGQDVTGDGIADFLSSSPYINDGYLVTWDSSTAPATTLAGSYSGELFGFSIAIVPDLNFDGIADVLVGAPDAANNRGRVALHDLTTLAQDKITEFAGDSQGDLLGSSVASAGDVAQSSNSGLFSPMLVGAIGADDMTGELKSFSRHIKDIVLSTTGSFNWYTDVTIIANDLADDSDGILYWYVGESNTPSTFGNHDLDISGNVQLIATFVNPGTQASQTFNIPDTYAEGQTLVFQLVEERGSLTHSSNVTGGLVSEPPPPFGLFNQGNTAGQVMTLEVIGAAAGAPIEFYGTGNSAIDPIGESLLASSTADANGESSVFVYVPGNLHGVTVYLRAQDLSDNKKTQILIVALN